MGCWNRFQGGRTVFAMRASPVTTPLHRPPTPTSSGSVADASTPAPDAAPVTVPAGDGAGGDNGGAGSVPLAASPSTLPHPAPRSVYFFGNARAEIGRAHV